MIKALAGIVFISLTICADISFSQSDTHYYRLNTKSGKCESAQDNLKPLDPIPVSGYPQINKNFLAKSSVCAKAKTCVFPGRLQFLTWNRLIPIPADYSAFEKKFTNESCPVLTKNGDSLEQLRNRFLSILEPTVEAEMILKMTNESKALADNYLKNSRRAIEALIQCFELDQKMEKNFGPLSMEEKIKKYNPEYNPQDKKTHRICERIWDSSSDFRKFENSLSESRMSLFAYQLFESGAVKSDDDFADAMMNITVGTPEGKEMAGQMRLKPLKGEVLGLTKSDYWKDTPKSLDPLNDYEQRKIMAYLKKVKESYPQLSWKDAAALSYFDKISSDPLLIYFDKVRPTGADYLKALKAHQGKQQQNEKMFSGKDQYLNLTSTLEFFLKNKIQPEDIGDYCVLASKMISDREMHGETPEKLAAWYMAARAGLYLLEGPLSNVATPYLSVNGKALTLFKGLKQNFGRLAEAAKNKEAAVALYKDIQQGLRELLMLSPVSGVVLTASTLAKGYEKYSSMLSSCTSTYQTSNELCNVGTLETQYTSNTVILGMGLYFSGRKGQQIIGTAGLTSDVLNSK